ncbi:AsmA family protein [Rhodoblastus sp.]|uniref:AsmA family protein n=1 Tax=Rhodoblastus sp. TaxID=1962975 RepID=UPI0035B17DCB
MRDLLTYIGIALIVVLSAAFAAPFLIDFDAFRPAIAEELTQATGAQVRFKGPVAVKFLPTPRFSAENLDISGESYRFHADKARFALSLPGLLRGRLQFSRAALDGAELVLDADKMRRPNLAAPLQFDALVLRRAHIVVTRGGAPSVEIAGLDLNAEIPSLRGPLSGRGGFDWRGNRIGFSVASDALAKNLLPLKANFTGPDDSGRLELDGRVDLTKAPAFEGEAKASGKAAPGPWTAQGPLLVGLDGALAREATVRLGDGPLADKLSGSARYETAGGKLVLAVEAPLLSRAWSEFLAAPLLAAESALPLDLRFGVGALNWRGMDLSQAELIWRPGAPAQFKAQGPGAARIEASVAPDQTGWRGKTQLKTSDFATFAAALGDAAPAVGKALGGADVHALELGGDIMASPDEWALTNASLAFGRARFSGELRFRPVQADGRPLLAARLAAPALDLDSVPDFSGAAFDALDLDLSIEAQTMRSARAGELSGDGGRIRAHLLRAGDALQLERLELRNIGGADLTASASWGRDGAGLKGEARLKAGDAGPLAQVLARLWPGAATKALAARARALSPADLSGKAGESGFSLNGTLGATRIAASLAADQAGQRAVAVDLSAPEAGALLNQLGAQAVWGQRLGAARISLHTQGDPQSNGARNVTASAELAGLRGAFRGSMSDPARDWAVEGEANLAGDAGKILGAFTAAPAASVPLRLAARALWRDGALALQNLNGEAAGSKLSGDLTASGDGLAGALRLDRLSAPALVALVLGPPAPAKTGALWSSLSFSPTGIDPPRAKLAIETGELQPFGARGRFDLALGPGALSIAGAELEAFGGTMRGGIDLRRDGAQATLGGEIEVRNIVLKNPALSARLDGAAKFAGNGGSAAALIGSLAGDGAATVRDLVIEGAAAGAPDQALAASEASEAPFDTKEVAKSLDAAFARAPLRRPEAHFALRLASGQAAFAPTDEGGQGIEAGFDLRDATLSVAVSAAAQKLPAGWNGAAPRGTMVWSGAWRSPARRVDAAAFVNAVATRALEREQARIERQRREDQERIRALREQAPPPAPEPQPAP